MDSVTHGLLGAVTAQLGFRQRIGREAAWVAAGAAVAPDLDILVGPLLSLTGVQLDGMASLTIHRGLSHSLLAVPVIALPIAGLWWWVRGAMRRREVRQAEENAAPKPQARFALLLACVLAAVLTHSLLDWCTSYGTQILAPVCSTRFAADAVPIIDIIYTPILLLTLVACLVVRRIARRPVPRRTLIAGWTGFLLSLAYLGAGRVMHDVARAKGIWGAGNFEVLRADAYPATGTIFVWRTVVESDDRWFVAKVHILGGTFRANDVLKVAPEDPWVRQAEELPDVKSFRWFAMDRVRATYDRRDGLHIVEFHDMRYGPRPESVESMWTLRVTFDDAGRQVGTERVSRHTRGSFPKRLADAWRDLWEP